MGKTFLGELDVEESMPFKNEEYCLLSSACSLLRAEFLLGLFFVHEDGGSISLRNVKLSPEPVLFVVTAVGTSNSIILQEIMGRTNRLLFFDTTRTASKRNKLGERHRQTHSTIS
jgi:hypothetical protein